MHDQNYKSDTGITEQQLHWFDALNILLLVSPKSSSAKHTDWDPPAPQIEPISGRHARPGYPLCVMDQASPNILLAGVRRGHLGKIISSYSPTKRETEIGGRGSGSIGALYIPFGRSSFF